MWGLMIREAIKMYHTLGIECLACENIDLTCSGHYASLMLMVVLLQ